MQDILLGWLIGMCLFWWGYLHGGIWIKETMKAIGREYNDK